MRQLSFSAFALLLLITACGTDSGRAERSAAKMSGAVTQASKVAEETVTFNTSDGVVITGTLYTAGKSAMPGVLCLHQWREDRGSFATLARKLAQAGYAVLAIDMRGYGQSTKTVSGETVRPDREAGEDIKAALAFMRQSRVFDASRLGIIGASYGSSNAVIQAAKDPGVKSLVLLSPGLNYFQVLPTEPAVTAYGKRPMLAVASSEDVRSVEAVNRYKEIGGNVETKIYDNAGHGTEMLGAVPGLTGEIIGFLGRTL